MFDLIEENLLTSAVPASSPAVTPQAVTESSVPAVVSMPERYRPKVDQKLPIKAIALGAGALIMVTIGLLGFLILTRAQQKALVLEELEPTPPVPAAPVAVSSISTSSDQFVATIPPEADAYQFSSSSSIPIQSQEISVQEPLADSAQTDSPPLPGAKPLTQENPADDLDNDHLTNAEERLMGTDNEKPDTDEDGFLDGNEIQNGYDPLSQGAKLEGSLSVNSYTNKALQYRFIYPSSWLSKALQADEKEVLITSATGEFISLVSEDNPKKLSATEWALSVANHADATSITQKPSGVFSDDGLHAYLSSPTGTKMLIITYSLNSAPQASFQSLFQMIVRSVIF